MRERKWKNAINWAKKDKDKELKVGSMIKYEKRKQIEDKITDKIERKHKK